MMPVSGLHRQVASIALAAAKQHGFALGGGNALLAHGLTTRPTQDVDLFTDQEHGVEAAAAAVERALAAARLHAERQDDTAGLADLFPGMGQGLAEWLVTAPDGEQTVLQMAYFDRSRAPVVMEIGPVLALEDVVGGKVCALASRVEPRDYADVARMLDRYSPAELIGCAGRLDSGLTAQDFADAGMQLDRIADEEFFRYGLSQQDIAALRGKFAVWPRTPQAVIPEIPARGLRHPDTPAQHRPSPQRDAPELGQYQAHAALASAASLNNCHQRPASSTRVAADAGVFSLTVGVVSPCG